MALFDAPVHDIPQQCGTCGHRHVPDVSPRTGAAGVVAACGLCGCRQFRLHDAEVERANRFKAEDAQCCDPAGMLMPAGFAFAVRCGAECVEQEWQRLYGWGEDPQIGLMCVGIPVSLDDTSDRPGLSARAVDHSSLGVLSVPLQIPPQAWRTTHLGAMLHDIAEIAEQRGTLFDQILADAHVRDEPVVAWYAIAEVLAYPDDQPVTRDTPKTRTRAMVVVDVDERVHQIVRYRHDREAEISTVHLHHLTDELAESDGPMQQMVRDLVRLMRVSRNQEYLRALLHGSDTE